MIHPQYIFFSFGVLAFFPFLFYLIAFDKKFDFINIITSILISEFILCFFLEIFSLYNFNKSIILTLVIISLIISGYFLRTRLSLRSKKMQKEYYLLIILFIFILFIEKNRFPPFWPDSFSTYLQYGRTIVEDGKLPLYDYSNIRYIFAYPPLLYTKIAFLFSIFNNFFDSTTVGIPIFYTLLTFFILINWSKEYSDEKEVQYFVLMSFLLSISIIHSTMLLQESPLIFFSSLSFYLLDRYLKKKEDFILNLLFISCCLCMLTKYSGLVITLLIFSALIHKGYIKKMILKIPLLIPAIFWYLRNFIFYKNPFPPLLSGFFKENIYEMSLFATIYKIPTDIDNLNIISISFRFLILFPAIIFVIIYMIKKRKIFYIKFIAFSFLVYFLVFFQAFGHFHVRYFAPFYGVFSLFSGLELCKIWKKIFGNKKILVKILFLITLIITILGSYSETGELIPSKLNKNALNPFYVENPEEKWPEEFNIIEIGVHDTFVVGDYSGVLSWYGRNLVMPFNSYSFKIKVKEEINSDKDGEYYYRLFKSIGAQYVYDSPENKSYQEIFYKLENDEKRFELIFDLNGYKVWRVKYNE